MPKEKHFTTGKFVTLHKALGCSMQAPLLPVPGVGRKSYKQRTKDAASHQSQLLSMQYLHTIAPTSYKHLGNSTKKMTGLSPPHIFFLNNSLHCKCFCTIPTGPCSTRLKQKM